MLALDHGGERCRRRVEVGADVAARIAEDATHDRAVRGSPKADPGRSGAASRRAARAAAPGDRGPAPGADPARVASAPSARTHSTPLRRPPPERRVHRDVEPRSSSELDLDGDEGRQLEQRGLRDGSAGRGRGRAPAKGSRDLGERRGCGARVPSASSSRSAASVDDHRGGVDGGREPVGDVAPPAVATMPAARACGRGEERHDRRSRPRRGRRAVARAARRAPAGACDGRLAAHERVDARAGLDVIPRERRHRPLEAEGRDSHANLSVPPLDGFPARLAATCHSRIMQRSHRVWQAGACGSPHDLLFEMPARARRRLVGLVPPVEHAMPPGLAPPLLRRRSRSGSRAGARAPRSPGRSASARLVAAVEEHGVERRVLERRAGGRSGRSSSTSRSRPSSRNRASFDEPRIAARDEHAARGSGSRAARVLRAQTRASARAPRRPRDAVTDLEAAPLALAGGELDDLARAAARDRLATGAEPCSILITTWSASRKTTSIGKRMNAVWMLQPGRSTMPSSWRELPRGRGARASAGARGRRRRRARRRSDRLPGGASACRHAPLSASASTMLMIIGSEDHDEHAPGR